MLRSVIGVSGGRATAAEYEWLSPSASGGRSVAAKDDDQDAEHEHRRNDQQRVAEQCEQAEPRSPPPDRRTCLAASRPSDPAAAPRTVSSPGGAATRDHPSVVGAGEDPQADPEAPVLDRVRDPVQPPREPPEQRQQAASSCSRLRRSAAGSSAVRRALASGLAGAGEQIEPRVDQRRLPSTVARPRKTAATSGGIPSSLLVTSFRNAAKALCRLSHSPS